MACAAMVAVARLAIALELRMPVAAAGAPGGPLPVRVVDAGFASAEPYPAGAAPRAVESTAGSPNGRGLPGWT